MGDGRLSTEVVASPLTGAELVEVMQDGESRVSTTQEVADLALGASADSGTPGGAGGGATPTTDSGRVWNSTNQAVVSGDNKIDFDTVAFDPGSIWDSVNEWFLPTQPGYYIVSINLLMFTSATTACWLYKNGARECICSGANSLNYGTGGSVIVYCNGTTDYLEAYMWTNASETIHHGNNGAYTNFSITGPL